MTTDHYISNQEILVYGRSVVFSEYSCFYFYFIRGHLIVCQLLVILHIKIFLGGEFNLRFQDKTMYKNYEFPPPIKLTATIQPKLLKVALNTITPPPHTHTHKSREGFKKCIIHYFVQISLRNGLCEVVFKFTVCSKSY